MMSEALYQLASVIGTPGIYLMMLLEAVPTVPSFPVATQVRATEPSVAPVKAERVVMAAGAVTSAPRRCFDSQKVHRLRSGEKIG